MAVNKTQQLIYAITKANKALVSDLIAQGININSPNQYNVTPLEVALKMVNNEIVNLLLSHGAKLRPAASGFYHSQINWHIRHKKRNPTLDQNKY